MPDWRAGFGERVIEVELYLKFVEEISRVGTTITVGGRLRPAKARRVGEDVQILLKAGFFLVMYNLVEATIRTGLNAICDAVHSADLDYPTAHRLVRDLWVRGEFSGLESSGNSNPASFRKKAAELIETAISRSAIRIEEDTLKIAGTLDARKVREIAQQVGFSSTVDRRTRGGERLLIVKNRRNALAHGELSFSECGRNYTVEELASIKKEVVLYLRGIMANIERYVTTRGFAA